MQLSNEDQETTISFNKAEDMASVFTYEKKWQQHIEKGFGLKPTLDNGCGGKEYYIPKSRIRMPLVPKKLSAGQRRKIGQRLQKAHRQKSPNRLGNNTA